MKIAFFTDTYYPELNGVATSVENFAEALRKQGHTVYIFAPKIKGTYKDNDRSVFRLPSLKVLSHVEPEIYAPTLWPNKNFRRMFNKKFDIIHAHGNGPYSLLGLSVARLKGVPFVMTFHTIHTYYTHYIFNGHVITPKMVEIALKTFAQRCDGVFTPSEKMKKELQKYGVKKEITVVPNFLDFERFAHYKKNYLYKLLNLSLDIPLIVTVGRIGKEKNIDFILRVFKQVFAKDAKSHLVVVGKGPEKDNLQALARKLKIADRTHFVGAIDYANMPSVYHNAVLFVFASYTETQGVCVLEAASAGIPSVVSDDGAFQNMVVNGENGFTLPLDEDKFAEKILLLLADHKLRDQLAKKSRAVALRNFDGEKITEKLVEQYLSVKKIHHDKRE
jgi:glycosyltransferase involved in cell wall biosynthesis